MTNAKGLFKKVIAIVLVVCMISSMLSGCASSNQIPELEIDTSAIADTITTEIQNQADSTEQAELPVETAFSTDWFVYEKIFSDYSLAYDTFDAVLHLGDGTEIVGIGYTDFSAYYETTDGELGFFPAGFIADVGGIIPYDQTEDGLIIENLDYTDEKYQFVYAYDTEPFMEHCVVNGQYLKYGVNDNGAITYEAQAYQRGYCDESLGALYSYDEGKYLFDPDMGTYIPISGTSLFESIDYTELEAEVNRILAEQDANFSEQDVITSAYMAQEAVVSYFLSMQEETFLGYDVDELVACAEELDPMECIRITPEGYIIIEVENNPPEGADAVAKWAVGIGCGIVVIGSTALNIFVPAARPFCGAITGAAIDVFMQVVIDNQTVDNIQWSKVAVAAVSGAMMAWLCPLAAGQVTSVATKAFESAVLGKLCGYGVLTLTNGLVSGVTGYANAMIDGEEDGWNAFLLGAAIGAGCTVFASALSELLAAVAPHVTSLLSHTKPGQWLNKVTGKVGLFIQGHQINVSDKLDDILNPKSVHEAARQAMLELTNQTGAAGGAYTQLVANGSERHEMPSFSSVSNATGVENRAQANLPAIKMSPQDHRMTASFGNSAASAQYRADQAKLIAQGNYRAAIQMDIDDITSKFGTKYNDAIMEMLEYATKMGWW